MGQNTSNSVWKPCEDLQKTFDLCHCQQRVYNKVLRWNFVIDQILISHHNLQINSLKILQCDFLDFCSYFVSHSWGIPMMKITGLSHLFKWENLHNWWLTKYFFCPTVCMYVYVCVCVIYFNVKILPSMFVHIHIYIYIYMCVQTLEFHSGPCMRPYDEYRQFTPNPEWGARSNATLFDNRQQKISECCELHTWKQSPLDSDHVLILILSHGLTRALCSYILPLSFVQIQIFHHSSMFAM